MFSLSIPPSAPPAHLSTPPPNYSQKTHQKSPDSAMASQGAHNTPRPHHTTTTTGGGREDCWSEAATETLVEAWGDRYLQLNRGNLRQKDWKEVADAVNGHHNSDKPRRSDVQCKNRVDTLKKKYKLERSKPVPSKWPFYSRLDYLVGASVAVTPTRSVQKPSTVVTLTVKSSPNSNPNPNPNPNPKKNTNTNVVVYSRGSSSKLNSSGSNESDLGGGDDDELLFGGVRKHRIECVEFSEETAYKELARAILRFGEIYERIENSKQQQMMELEKERMEFTKDLEFQRMNMFMEAQVELEKMKRPTKYAPGPGAGKKL